MKQYFVIGKVPGYNNAIDLNEKELEKLYNKLTIVDMIPRTMILNGPTKILKSFSVDKLGEMFQGAIKYANPSHPMKWFDMVMQKHSEYLDSYQPGKYDGIRLICTTDSAINNSISHQYKNNPMDSGMDGVLSGLKNAIANSGKAGAIASQAIDALSGLTDMYDLYSGNQYNPDQGWKGATKAFSSGRRTKFPKIWESSNVADILQLSVKLTSPSGDPAAVKRYIIEPLIILFIMGSPMTITGLDLSTPFIYETHAKGIGHYKLSGIMNINLDRGGTDTIFNDYNQPLTVNARLTIQPLSSDAATSLKGTSLYEKAWYQTPKTIYDSLSPDDEFKKGK